MARRPRIRLTRDAVLFALGIVIVVHELFLSHSDERPFLLMIAAALLGLPVFLRKNGL